MRLVCPKCHSKLLTKENSYSCAKCKTTWPIVDKIPKFAHSEVKWSVFDEDVADKVTDLAEQTTWQQAIDAYRHTIGEYTLNYIQDESRADWHVILPIDSETIVLDIGSGWGNIATSISKWCKQVYCCDVSMRNLRLLHTRILDCNIGNISTFQYEPNAFLQLPFPDSSIDVVLLNGVLEWMGAANINASPNQIQQEALKEIRRILKPGGVLYIGIENRFSTSTLRGQRIHGELPFIGLMPRWLSNTLTRLVRGKEHRTFIYSLRGYRTLLRQGGFEQVDFFLPYPSYHHPNYLIPLYPGWVKRFWLNQLSVSKSIKYRIFKRLGLSWLPFHWVAYSFSIRCTK